MKTRFFMLWLHGLCLAVLAGSCGWAQCKPGDPAGRFEGSATSAQAGKLDITLNLVCADGHYAGTLTTPLGPYNVTAGSLENGALRLRFEQSGAQELVVQATIVNGGLEGSFVSGDDKGPIQLRRVGDAAPPATQQGGISLTPQQWREDLAFLARELPKRHPAPFLYTPKEKFEAAVAELDKNIDHLDADAVYIGLDHLANLIGDAHTFIEFPDDNANLPLDIRHFGDDARVVAVGAGNEQALGARVIAIGDTPLAKARELAALITPVGETEQLKEARVDGFLTTGMALHGLGITPARDQARYTLAGDDGKRFVIDFKALGAKQEPHWVNVAKQVPLSAQPIKGSAACTYLADSRALYCNVRRIRDLGGPSKEMLSLIAHDHPDKVIIDLRRNGGGDFNEGVKYLIEPLAKEKEINRKGHLFVLIGVNTFSAAMSNAAQFRSMTNATLVGETIGERPNSYQEPRQFTLPNSHLVVRYSTRYYKFVESGDNVVSPDKAITTSWEDYKAGRDAALEWVLASKE